MRIRDLTWRGLPIWPPEWHFRSGELGEEGFLLGVQIRRGISSDLIHLEAGEGDDTRRGIIALENPGHLQALYRRLQEYIGRPLTEIGDLEINLNGPGL